MEAVAAVQYMSSWPWSWANWTKNFIKNGDITFEGIGVVFIFMLIFTMINFWSVKIMTHFTNLISIFKILLPTLMKNARKSPYFNAGMDRAKLT